MFRPSPHLPATRFRVVLFAAALALAPLPVERTADAAIGDQLLPNLRATPASNIAFGSGTDLRFSTFSWNAGTGPLELSAGTVNNATSRQDVWQRIYREGTTSVYRNAGSFVWHPDHNHFHFDDYARYTIELTNGSGAATKTGQKTTFCVMDTNAQDLTLTGAPRSGYYTACGNTYQGMSVGWGDRYGSSLAGQSLDMAGMPNGDYKLTIEIDPFNRITETTRADNVSCVLLRVSVTARTVQVLNPGGCATPDPVTFSSLTPNTLSVGGTVAVTLKGSGFVAGSSMSLANGSGTVPTISGVTVVDSTTATATFSLRRKSKVGTDRLWDLNFGGATFQDALTVNP